LAGEEIDPTHGSAPASDSSRTTFDLGPLLARGQTIRHEFTLTNPTEKTVRLVKATCFTPCCSAVGPLPESIPPHGQGNVAVIFKPGQQTGHKAVQFAVETDSRDQPTRLLTLRARLFSEWEIAPVGDPIGSVPVGRTGKGTFRIVCRRRGSEGLRSPVDLKAAESIQARFTGSAEEQVQPDGGVETIRDVEVTLPAIQKLGPQQAEIAFLWPDGRRITHRVRWDVSPLLRLSPSSIVVEATDKPVEQPITITSDDGPFGVTKIEGALLARPIDAPSAAEKTHHLILRLDPARVAGGGVSTIVIGTDHLNQHELMFRVLILPSEREKRGAS
jgi:hypothetical protein